jgi:hypothetical protein
MSKEKWIVVFDSEPCAIGPFNCYEDAKKYQDSSGHPTYDMRTMQLYSLARGWRSEPRYEVTPTGVAELKWKLA